MSIVEASTYKGYKSFDVDDFVVDELYKSGSIKVWDKRLAFYPNMYVELRSNINEKHTALGKVNCDGENIVRLKTITASGVTPRNREQVFALDALMDDTVPIVVLTGLAGCGKTILALSMALQKMDQGKYKKVVITRPMSQVGKYELGALPGGVNEKLGPYLIGFTSNLETLTGKNNVDFLLQQCKFEMIPIQLFRGASFNNTIVIVDEAQVLDHMEMLTIGTRLGENSKLIIMGDLNQRDERIAKDKTGIHKLMHDIRVKESDLVAVVELQKCERSRSAMLFSSIFEE